MTDEIRIELFTGDNLLQRETDVLAIVDGYLWERDVVMLLGSEKSGKSILALQMAMNISMGTPFLDKYICLKRPVIYLQTEGKKDETPVRMEKMMRKLEADKTIFYRLYKKFLPIDVLEYGLSLEKKFDEIKENIKGGVLFIDCLYTTMVGDINENKDIRRFLACMSAILEKYGLTCIVVHHERKEQFFEGHVLEVGDKGSYGSVFLRANVDHIIFLDKKKDQTRTLTCDTQRSGQVSERETLVLVEPSPLFFHISNGRTGSEETVYQNLVRQEMTRGQLMEITKKSESTIHKAISKLLGDDLIDIKGEVDGKRGQKEKVYGTR